MRQFHQIGIEYQVLVEPLADAEIIACGARVLSDLGILDRCVLHLNSLGDTESRLAYRRALVAFLTENQADLSENSKERLIVNPLRILDSKDPRDRGILQSAPSLKDHLNDSSKFHFAAVTAALDASGIGEFDRLLVRGLLLSSPLNSSLMLWRAGTVLGGGRYDGLAEMLGDPALLASVGRLALNGLPCSLVLMIWRHLILPQLRRSRRRR